MGFIAHHVKNISHIILILPKNKKAIFEKKNPDTITG